jgi:hypothetical protein
MTQNAKKPAPGAGGGLSKIEQPGQHTRAFHSAKPVDDQTKSARDAAVRTLSGGRRA